MFWVLLKPWRSNCDNLYFERSLLDMCKRMVEWIILHSTVCWSLWLQLTYAKYVAFEVSSSTCYNSSSAQCLVYVFCSMPCLCVLHTQIFFRGSLWSVFPLIVLFRPAEGKGVGVNGKAMGCFPINMNQGWGPSLLSGQRGWEAERRHSGIVATMKLCWPLDQLLSASLVEAGHVVLGN